MALETTLDRAICAKCGIAFSRMKGFFPVSYAMLYKGIQHIPICRDCIDTMYSAYLSQCSDSKAAVRQMCRKLDLYWNDNIFEAVTKKASTRTMMTQYLTKLNGVSIAGKSYDDTLLEEGTMWSFNAPKSKNNSAGNFTATNDGNDGGDEMTGEVPEDVIAFWGEEYTPATYSKLERWRAVYMSKLQLPDDAELDIGTEGLIRQACTLELAISRETAAGRNPDKLITTLNTVYGSLNFKPTQKNASDDDASLAETPLGVWLYRYETKKPLPEIDDSLKDRNKMKKYIFTWMGHLCKMMGKKNGYTKLYDEEMSRLRVEKPEYDDESDEDVMIDAYSEEDYE